MRDDASLRSGSRSSIRCGDTASSTGHARGTQVLVHEPRHAQKHDLGVRILVTDPNAALVDLPGCPAGERIVGRRCPCGEGRMRGTVEFLAISVGQQTRPKLLGRQLDALRRVPGQLVAVEPVDIDSVASEERPLSAESSHGRHHCGWREQQGGKERANGLCCRRCCRTSIGRA
jgi:hypothetical protein